MKLPHVEQIPRRLGPWFAALALAACAVDVDSSPQPSREEQGVSQAELARIGPETTPSCKEDEVLCCPNGGPRCVCLPAGHTCTSGPVISPGFEFVP
jgi:hypothetical protein